MTLGSRVVVLAEGRAQQIGAPLEIYRRPANRFVASFIGTTPMGLLDARLEATAQGQWCVVGRSIRVPVSREIVDRAASPEVVLGLRPERLRALGPGDATLEGTVALVEPLGDRMDVAFDTPDGQRVVARIPSDDRYRVGDLAVFHVRADECHIFAPGTYGVNLTLDA